MPTTIRAIPPSIEQYYDQTLLQKQSGTLHYNPIKPIHAKPIPDIPTASDFLEEYSRNQAKPLFKMSSRAVITNDDWIQNLANQDSPKYKVRSKVVMKNDGFLDKYRAKPTEGVLNNDRTRFMIPSIDYAYWGCGYHPTGDGSIWVNNKTGEVWNVNNT